MSSNPHPAALTLNLRRWLVLLLLCLAPLSIARASAPESPLARLALALIDAPAPLRADLAQAVLFELSDTYAREADQARADQRRETRGRDLQRWAAAIDNLAREYAALAESVMPLTPVGIRVGPDRTLYLNVAGKAIAVSGPRPHEQAALEQRMLARYCYLNRCDPETFAAGMTASTLSPAAGHPLAASSAPAADTHWSFSPAGPVCASGDGLEFQFENADDLRHKRAACAAVIAELNLLTDSLARQIALGTNIDWNALAIGSATDGELQRITLNHSGAELYLRVPTLTTVPELVSLVRPWLIAKARNERYGLVILHADRHMAQVFVIR